MWETRYGVLHCTLKGDQKGLGGGCHDASFQHRGVRFLRCRLYLYEENWPFFRSVFELVCAQYSSIVVQLLCSVGVEFLPTTTERLNTLSLTILPPFIFCRGSDKNNATMAILRLSKPTIVFYTTKQQQPR